MVYHRQSLPSYEEKYPLVLDGMVERTTQHYIAIGEHSDLYLGKFNRDLYNKIPLAVKVLRGATSNQSDFKQRFNQALERAAETWAKLNFAPHPHVARFYGIAYDHGLMPAIISTYYPRGNIIDYIKKESISSEKRVSLVKDIADGLNHLHTFNPPIVHGDLRGNNVLITQDGRAVLSDYGLSFIIQSSDFTSVKTAGTCRWTAPEIMNPPEENIADGPSVPYSLPGDIYAYAMTVVEIYTGNAPFHEKKNDSAVIFMVIDGKRPQLPKEIEESHLKLLVEKCWKQDPNERPVSTEVVRHLNANLPKPGFFQWVWAKFSAYLSSSFGSPY